MLQVIGRKGQSRSQIIFFQLGVRVEDVDERAAGASFRRISSTVTRVPLTHGLPIMILGSTAMRA